MGSCACTAAFTGRGASRNRPAQAFHAAGGDDHAHHVDDHAGELQSEPDVLPRLDRQVVEPRPEEDVDDEVADVAGEEYRDQGPDAEIGDDVLAHPFQALIGKPLDRRTLKRSIEELYGWNIFESIRYEIMEEEGKQGFDGKVLRNGVLGQVADRVRSPGGY